METCGTCRFFKHEYGDDADHGIRYGLCRRHAPMVQAYSSGGWPRTYAKDWCGEYASVRREPEAPGAEAREG